MKKIFLLSILSVFVSHTFAQQYNLKVSAVDGKNAVAIKWFSDSVNFSNTFNLYKKVAGDADWTKLNTAPIAAQTPLTSSELKKKEYAKAITQYSVMMNLSSQDKQMFLPFLIVQSITDNDLAAVIGHYYLDENVTTEKTYSYKLMILSGNKETEVADTTFTFHAFQKPVAPVGLNVESGNQAFKIKWSYNNLFPVYHLYRGTVTGKSDTMFSIFPGAAMIDSFKKGKWMTMDIDSNLQTGKKYFYKIAGVDFFGNETQTSAEVSATLNDASLPPTVRTLVSNFVDDGKNVILIWAKATSDKIKGFNVYRSTGKNIPYTKLNSNLISKSDTSFIDKTTTPQTHYIYCVETEGINGMKNISAHIELTTADITPPSVPTGLRATSDSVSVTITWNKNTEKDLRGYFVFSALKPNDENFNLLSKDPVTSTTWKDYYPKNITSKFYYKICAIDSSYNRSASTTPVSVSMPDKVAPTNSFIKHITYQQGKIVLSWPASNSTDVAGYNIYRCTDSVSSHVVLINTSLIHAVDTSFTDLKITSGKKYFYAIAVVDSAGNQSAKSEFRIISTISDATPTPPANVRAVFTSTKSVSITWTKEEGIQYQIFKSTDDGSFLPITDIAAASSFIDSQVETGHHYNYKVKAYSSEEASDFSAAVFVEVK